MVLVYRLLSCFKFVQGVVSGFISFNLELVVCPNGIKICINKLFDGVFQILVDYWFEGNNVSKCSPFSCLVSFFIPLNANMRR